MFLSPDSGSCVILRSIDELTPFLFPVTPSGRCSRELYVPGEHKARSLLRPRGAGGVRTAQTRPSVCSRARPLNPSTSWGTSAPEQLCYTQCQRLRGMMASSSNSGQAGGDLPGLWRA